MNHSTQCQKILELLRSRNGQWVELPAILALGIAQYNARIYKLRKDGHEIENRTKKQPDGAKHSWYRLREQGSLFPV